MYRETVSWAQYTLMLAASYVHYLPFKAMAQSNIPHGVWRSLAIRGFMRQVTWGWKLTERGKEVLKSGHLIVLKHRKDGVLMSEGKRYRVSRLPEGWAVIDHHQPRAIERNNVIELFKARTPARLKCQQMNHEEREQQVEEGAA